MLRTICIFAFFVTAAASAQAQLVELPLNVKSSVVTLQLQGPLLNAKGSAANYSGILALDRSDFTRSRVTINADLSAVSLHGVDQLSGFNLEPLFKGIPNPQVVFSSTVIKQISGNRYLVQGTWTRGRKTQTISLPVDLVKVGARIAQVRVAVSGPVERGHNLGELGGLFAGTQGRAEALLVFSR